MLLGAQQYTTVESAAALNIQEKFKGKYDDNICNANGQYRNEWYKRAENMVPQLDGTYNVSDDSDLDSHSYFDLASSNIIAHRMRGQKQRHETDIRAHTSKCLAFKESMGPNVNINMKGQRVPDDENIDINKIAQGERPKRGRNTADITAKQHKDKKAKRLVPEKVKRIQGQNDSMNIEAKRHMIEKAKIEAFIEKHRLHTPKTPDEVNKSGTGKNATEKGQEGTRQGKPPYKKATKDIQIKKLHKKGTEATNAETGKVDTLLGDPVANTATGIEKEKEKGQKDKIGIDDIGIFEFIFKGLPELPELEGVDEDRLRDLQNAVQEQLHKRDEERERNTTKRVQEFEKTFDFVNSHLLKGVATMAELTKSDSRQPMGKIKPTDKMVMMPSLFDGTKPAMSKQHYERFNLYINFQTKSGHLMDPVKEAIDLFEHTLDKTALVWFQMNKSKFKDLTTLKMMFLQRYNPWGKTKREQLQSWNILSFNPKTTDVDEHIDLVNTLGDMVDQKEEAKMEKLIETMPTMIQTHLITCKDWVANTATGIEKEKEKGQKDKIGIDDIGIFEFIFKGLPELPELEGVDEDRLRDLQNAVQEQLHKRDEERERNTTKRVQEFEKTFDFVNSHLLKGVATMAELTKSDSRQPMGKIKPTDKMVMMLSLFDGTKPAMSKQHYERFNLYINFQTKSGHFTDPVKEAIDLFEHTLDKTALVWFQMNKSKFKDLTTLKMMFLQRYNPWGKTKREQLQSWNILSFNPKTTDVDEHIDLVNTLGDMVDQKEEAKMEKLIETMPTMIQTHLITCKDWDTVKDTAKSLEHIIMKCNPPTPAMPTMATGATVPRLYSHIAHSVDKEEGDIPQLFKGTKPKQTRGRGKPKGKPQDQRQNPPKVQEVEENYNNESPNNYYHNTSNQSQGHRPYNGQSGNQQFRGFVP